MSYEMRTYDTDAGDPVVVLVAKGSHDVSRLVNAMRHGTCEQSDVGVRMAASLRRHNRGRHALALLRAHGGPDLLEGDDEIERLRAAVALHRPEDVIYVDTILNTTYTRAACSECGENYPCPTVRAASGEADDE